MSNDQTGSILDPPAFNKNTYLEFLGFKIIAWKEGYTKIEMPVRPDHRNTVGYLHGGVIASLLDLAGAVAGSYGVSEKFVAITVNLNCNYMAPHTAETAIAEGELVRTTQSLFFAQARLMDPASHRLCATATGTYKRQSRDPNHAVPKKRDSS